MVNDLRLPEGFLTGSVETAGDQTLSWILAIALIVVILSVMVRVGIEIRKRGSGKE